MTHPLEALARRTAIELIHERGGVPQMLVDTTAEGVIVPEWVRRRWGKELIIDLDPGYPLELLMDDDGVHADLAFQGTLQRCVFPWLSITGTRMRDATAEENIALMEIVLQRTMGLPPAEAASTSKKPALTLVRGGKA